MNDMIVPDDPKTRVAVEATYVRQALEALRRAIALETGNVAWMNTAASDLAWKQSQLENEYAALRRQQVAGLPDEQEAGR